MFLSEFPVDFFEDTNLNMIDRLAHGLFPSLAMLAGMQLDLFSPLAGAPKIAEDLAAALGVSATKLRPLLDALVIAELLEVNADGRYANAPEADEFLVKGRPNYRGDLHAIFADDWLAVFRTAETIRTGRPQDLHDFSQMDEAMLATFYQGMHGGNVTKGRNLLAAGVDLDGHHQLLDVGGGSGGLAMALCEALPALSATIFELPRVAPITRRFVTDAGMQDRVAILEGDAVTTPPPGTYDLATISSVIQVLGPDDAAAVLTNVGIALRPGGRLVVLGRIMDDSRRTPPHVVLFNLVLLNIYDGGLAYTESEYRDWLTAAGFTAIERKKMIGAELITAVRAG